MEWVETTGKTVEEAKELALDQLGVDVTEAEFEVLEEPKSGLFGRTRGVARVRARVVPLAPRAKAERRRRPKKSDAAADRSAQSPSPESRGTDSSPAAATDAGADDGAAERPDSSSRERSNGRTSKDAPSGASTTPRERMDAEEQQQTLEEFLKGLADAFGLDATVAATMEDNELTGAVDGDGLGVLVGPRLATLDAIQEIARNALQRQAAGREYAKVVVDVAGVRELRRESLTTFVTDAAQQVLDDDVEVVLEVMSSVDRKQVHDVAGSIEGVATASEGEDPRRRVVLRKA